MSKIIQKQVITQNLQLLIDTEQLTREFFSNIETSSAAGIAGFLTDLERKERDAKNKKFEQQNLQKLLARINLLRDIEFTAPELGMVMNAMAGLGYKKDDLVGLDVSKITDHINKNIDTLSAKEVANIVNGFARLGYDRDEIKLDVSSLLMVINSKIDNFKGIDAVVAMHGFAFMGYGDFIKPVARKLAKKAAEKISFMDERAIASLTHSLAKMEMFEELFEIKDQVISALTPERISNLSSESAHSLLQADMICDLIYGEKFLSEEEFASIYSKYSPEKEKMSKLQKLVTSSLPTQFRQSEQPVYGDLRNIDIRYEINGKVYYIEVDGPLHYVGNSDKVNFATAQRDVINEAAIPRMAALNPEKEFHYVKISYREIENVVGKSFSITDRTKSNVTAFLDGKLEASIAITSEEIYLPEEIDFSEELIEKTQAMEINEIAVELVEKEPELSVKEARPEAVREIKTIINEMRKAPLKKMKNLVRELRARNNEEGLNGKFPLHLAVESKSVKLVSKLLEIEDSVDDLDQNQSTPLHIVAQNNSIEIARKLIERGANPAIENRDRETALDIALRQRNAEMLEILTAAKIDINVINHLTSENERIVDETAQEALNNSLIIKAILKKATDKNTLEGKFKIRLFEERDPLKISALAKKVATFNNAAEAFEIAQSQGRRDIILTMVKYGVPLSIPENEMLIEAINQSDLDMIKAIVERGTNLDESAAINYAINIEPVNIEIVNTLVSAGAIIPSYIDGARAANLLQKAIEKKQVETICAVINLDTTLLDERMVIQATKENSLPWLKAVLEKNGFNPNLLVNREALRIAIGTNSLELFNDLVLAGVDTRQIEISDVQWEHLLVALAHSEFKESFARLVEQNADKLKDLPFTRYNQGKISVLFLALLNNNKRAVESLVGAGADINLKAADNIIPLMLAIQNGHLDIARLLIDERTAVAKSSKKMTPINIAAYFGMGEIIPDLVNKGADINSLYSVHGAAEVGHSVLHEAVMKGYKNVVDIILSCPGVQVNLANAKGMAALYTAAQDNKVEIMKSLVTAGAEINQLTNAGGNAICIAAQRGHKAAVSYLIGLDGIEQTLNDINNPSLNDIHNPLHVAVTNQREAVTKLLLESGKVDVNSCINKYTSALQIAVQLNNLSMTKLLLDFGADINFAPEEVTSVLHCASQKGNTNMVKLLLEYKPTIDSKRVGSGDTPFMAAVNNNHTEIAKLLIAEGASVNTAARPEAGGTPSIQLVAQNGNLEILEAMLAKDGETLNLDAADINGVTALHSAAQGKVPFVKAMAKAGANMNATTIEKENGYSPLHIAVITDNVAMVQALLTIEGVDTDLKATDGKGIKEMAQSVEMKELLGVAPGVSPEPKTKITKKGKKR